MVPAPTICAAIGWAAQRDGVRPTRRHRSGGKRPAAIRGSDWVQQAQHRFRLGPLVRQRDGGHSASAEPLHGGPIFLRVVRARAARLFGVPEPDAVRDAAGTVLRLAFLPERRSDGEPRPEVQGIPQRGLRACGATSFEQTQAKAWCGETKISFSALRMC